MIALAVELLAFVKVVAQLGTKKIWLFLFVDLQAYLPTLGVELQGIEPWSREDKCVRSTCLVDFDCREAQGRQQPQLLRSYCCLNNDA